MKPGRLSLKENMIWNTWGSIFYLGCQWLLTVLVVWMGGFSDAGNLSLAMAVCNTFYSIAAYGMRNFQVSDIKGRFSNGTYIFSRILTSIAAFLMCVVFSLLNQYTMEQRLCIIIYMVFKLTESVFDVYAGIYQKEWRMDYIGKSMTIRGILCIFAFTFLLSSTQNLVLAITGMAVATVTAVIFYDIRIAGQLTDISLNLNRRAVRELLLSCLPLVVYVFLSSAIGSIPRYVIERFLGEEELGYYSSVATPTLIVQMASTYIFNPLVTVFAERYQLKDSKGFWIVFKKCLIAVAGVSFAAIAGAALFGNMGLKIIYAGQGKIAEYTYLLVPLVICTILTGFSWFLGGLLTVIREFKGLLVSNLAAVIICIVSSYLLVGKYGLQGGNVALILALLVEIVLLVIYLSRKIKLELKQAE